MSKKLISLLLTVCMLFCLSACVTTETNSSPTNTPSESQTDISQNIDESILTEPQNSQASSNTEASKENNTTQTQSTVNQSKPTSTTNQPTHTHSYSNATCTSPKKCSCGATTGTALDHQFSSATCTSPKTCTRCGETTGTALGHQFSSATCTSPQICSRCGAISGKALGHSYSDANCTSPKTCTICKNTFGDALGHNYVEGKCSRCNVIDPNWEIALFELKPFDSSDMFCKITDRYDTYGNFYDKLLSFGHNGNTYVNEAEVTYRIDNKYSNFSGVISYWDSSKSGWDGEYMDGNLTIKIYKNDEMIYMKDNITKWTEPIKFSLDITGCNFLKIVVYNSEDSYAYLNLGNAKLNK